ncbi:MAG TPA: AAA family ATPase [candidate division Zixibacteria bacterium]|nr:AAA family ATPase [candidate division Zixibacteria bacterium]
MSTIVSAVSPAVAESTKPFENGLEEVLAAIAYIDLHVRWAVERARAHGLDPNDESRGLFISEGQIDTLLSAEVGHDLWPNGDGQNPENDQWPEIIDKARNYWLARIDASRAAGIDLRLDDLTRRFGLSQTEVDILLVTLAPEIDPRYERLFAYLQDDVTKKRPSVDLVLNLLTTSFKEKLKLRHHFTDDGKLLASRLMIRFIDGANREPTLLGHYLRPADRVVEHLLGFPGLDDRLVGSAKLIESHSKTPVRRLPRALLDRLNQVIDNGKQAGSLPLLTFLGGYGVGKRTAARNISSRLESPLISVNLKALSESNIGLEDGLQVLLRDGLLLGANLYLNHWDTILDDDRPPDKLFSMLVAYPGLVIVAGEKEWQPRGEERQRRILLVSFETGDFEHRLQTWQQQLDGRNLQLFELANQFQFTPGQIEDAVATALDYAQWRQQPLSEEDLFAASRAHSNQKLAALATKISPRYSWDDIVLPPDTIALLQEMVNTVRQRPLVYGEWGFGRKLALGKGLNGLFAGESGTGKTMAADIMAGQLGQDLYKIDLSMMVSKYIGETEKNLNRVFTEAQTSNAILFFDEADAIFGKRSEVKDSHDRYANIEISYLLQRMEAYDGVVILATNLRANLDDAFTRRLHFIVEFPFPEAKDREIIWKVNFPVETPLQADVDLKLLAKRYRITGGNIRNIIMAAAFLAAEKGEPVGMVHLLHASRREYQKMGRLIDEQQFELEKKEIANEFAMS